MTTARCWMPFDLCGGELLQLSLLLLDEGAGPLLNVGPPRQSLGRGGGGGGGPSA